MCTHAVPWILVIAETNRSLVEMQFGQAIDLKRIGSSGKREDMLTIDAQFHAYERDHIGRPWVNVLTGPSDVTGDDMVKVKEASG
jgi:hypothetical protein